jgi:hypothetical protein
MTSGTTAHIVRFDRTSGPDVLGPTAETVPPSGEVRLAARAFGLNQAEMFIRPGRYGDHPALAARGARVERRERFSKIVVTV